MAKNHKIYGWICSLCFMFSGLPAALDALKTGTSNIHTGTLALWTMGEICAIIYIMPRRDIPLLANYTVNLMFISTLWYFKF
jgi:hypothetical protein